MTKKVENLRNIFQRNPDFSFCIKDKVLRSSANLFYKHIPIKYIYFEMQRNKLESLRSMKQSKVLSSFWLLKLFRLLSTKIHQSWLKFWQKWYKGTLNNKREHSENNFAFSLICLSHIFCIFCQNYSILSKMKCVKLGIFFNMQNMFLMFGISILMINHDGLMAIWSRQYRFV